MEDLVPIIAVTLSLSIPIVIIVGLVITYCNKKRNARLLRQEIINARLDIEYLPLLLDEESSKLSSPFRLMRIGLFLIFTGVGAIVANQFYSTADLLFYFIIAIASGMGLLLAFVIEWKMARKKTGQQDTITEESTSEP